MDDLKTSHAKAFQKQEKLKKKLTKDELDGVRFLSNKSSA